MPICPIARDSLPEPDYHLMVDLVAITSIRAGEIPMNKTVDCTRRDLVKLTAGTVLAAAAGGYVTAWAAAANPLIHVLALGIVVLAIAALSVLQSKGEQPIWYQLTLVALTPLGVLAGGLVRLRVLGIL